MRISSPGPTLILTGRGSDIRLGTALDRSDGDGPGGARGMDRADGGGDRDGGKDKRADGGRGDAGEAIEAEHFPVSLYLGLCSCRADHRRDTFCQAGPVPN